MRHSTILLAVLVLCCATLTCASHFSRIAQQVQQSHDLQQGMTNRIHNSFTNLAAYPTATTGDITVTDIIIIVIVVCLVIFCCGGFGYHRYSRRGAIIV